MSEGRLGGSHIIKLPALDAPNIATTSYSSIDAKTLADIDKHYKQHQHRKYHQLQQSYKTCIPVLKSRLSHSPLGGLHGDAMIQQTASKRRMEFPHQIRQVLKPKLKASKERLLPDLRPIKTSMYVSSRKRSTPDGRHISSYDLNPDIVTSYLNDNPEFLESYVLRHTSRDNIETWLKKKTHHAQKEKALKQSSTSTEGSSIHLNGDLSPTENIQRWKLSVQEDKRRLLQDITNKIQHDASTGRLLCEIATCCTAAIDADGFNVYLVNERDQELFLYHPSTQSAKLSSQYTRKIGPGSILAAYVAHSKESCILSPITKDDRFPEGVGILHGAVHSVMVHPVFTSAGSVQGVVELYRSKNSKRFVIKDEEECSDLMMYGDLIYKCHEKCSYLLLWGEVTLHFAELYHGMIRQRKLNDFLLTVTKSIFQDIVSMDTVIMKIMNYAKRLVNADRTSLFLADNRSKELYARVFDMGDDLEDNTLPAQKEIRFSMDKGVAGYVASSGEVLNIGDAYADHRFNRNVDLQTGYRTKTILCMPIYIRGNIIGVVQMVNKLDGSFTRADEEAFETFAVYCGLALHHAKLYEKIRRSEQKYRVSLEVLSYHAQAGEEEVQKLIARKVPQIIQNITDYEFSPWAVTSDDKPLHCIYMFVHLFGDIRVDMEALTRFTLTVRKNYRNVPYHNWSHAFSVAHAIYTVIKTSKNEFSTIEQIALFVACLCHDLDHRGKTNSFMVKSATPLAALYSTSTMEHHHFNQTVAILQNDGHNIFRHLTSEEYKEVLGDIKHCILSTDLALFFGNRAKLKEYCDTDVFDWKCKEHRHMVMANSMTACDLCSMYKPWELQLQLVHVIMEEFWIQGDEEKNQGVTPIPMMDREKSHQLPQSQGDKEKEAGEIPMAMMDRDKENELPSLEVGFLVGICLPCYELCAQVLPETQPMVNGAKDNLRRWQELVDQQERQSKLAIESAANKQSSKS